MRDGRGITRMKWSLIILAAFASLFKLMQTTPNLPVVPKAGTLIQSSWIKFIHRPQSFKMCFLENIICNGRKENAAFYLTEHGYFIEVPGQLTTAVSTHITAIFEHTITLLFNEAGRAEGNYAEASWLWPTFGFIHVQGSKPNKINQQLQVCSVTTVLNFATVIDCWNSQLSHNKCYTEAEHAGRASSSGSTYDKWNTVTFRVKYHSTAVLLI